MSAVDIRSVAYTGIQVGAAVAIIPAAVTSLIACSKIILVNLVAEIFVRIITANTMSITIYNIGFVSVSILWQVSLICAVVGAGILILSAAALLIQTIYERCILNEAEDQHAPEGSHEINSPGSQSSDAGDSEVSSLGSDTEVEGDEGEDHLPPLIDETEEGSLVSNSPTVQLT
jgi:hypothetical protein